jgi:hypothetical protein
MSLEFEAEAGMSTVPGSLLDKMLDGLVSCMGKFSFGKARGCTFPKFSRSDGAGKRNKAEKPESLPPRSDFVETLLRSPSASRVLEVALASSPPAVFSAIWRCYFRTRLCRLATHPVSNFVVAKGIERLDAAHIEGAVREIANGTDVSKSQARDPHLGSSGGFAGQMIGSRACRF